MTTNLNYLNRKPIDISFNDLNTSIQSSVSQHTLSSTNSNNIPSIFQPMTTKTHSLPTQKIDLLPDLNQFRASNNINAQLNNSLSTERRNTVSTTTTTNTIDPFQTMKIIHTDSSLVNVSIGYVPRLKQ